MLIAALAARAAEPLVIDWELTPEAFAGKKAIVILDSGVRVEGAWLGVTPGTFTMEVEQARGAGRPPRGVRTFERSAIRSLGLQQRRVRGRVWGGIIGYWGGAAAAFQIPSMGAAALVLLLSMTGGVLAGRALDKAVREVRIKDGSQGPAS
jgi:hypothetical protein